jgi:Glycosyl hydrolase family 26
MHTLRSAMPRQPAVHPPTPTAQGRLLPRVLTAGATLALALAGALALAPAASARTPMYLGSVDGGYPQMVAGTGEPMADHAYAQLSGAVPDTRMVSMETGGTSWRSVAAAGPGTPLYSDLVRWAQTIKSRNHPVMVAYNHEPEADAGRQGSAADFIAAYRHVEDVFTAQGATNVEWTWQMTAYAFRTSAADLRYAAKWYPGDAYVDNVGADAYNWFTCGHGNGTWNELEVLGRPVLAFARAHGKAASFPEFATDANPGRVRWITNAHQYFLANQDVLSAAFYFNRPPTVAANSDCRWALQSRAEFDAFAAIVRDRAHFTA